MGIAFQYLLLGIEQARDDPNPDSIKPRTIQSSGYCIWFCAKSA